MSTIAPFLCSRRAGARGLALLVLALAPVAVDAQPDLVPHRNAITVQPLHAVFSAWSGEYERVLRPATSLAASVSRVDGEVGDFREDDGDDRRLSAEVKLRYYADARPFGGLSVGLLGGVMRERTSYYADGSPPLPGSVIRREWHASPTVGFLLEHGWSDRARRGILVAGLGGKRVMRRGPRPDEAYLTIRLSIGVAF